VSVERSSQTRELAFGTDAGLWDLMSTMRAMRRLKPDPVPRELLEQLVQAASWAPSAGNTQANAWLIVTDRARLAALAPIWRRCLRLYWASAGAQQSPTMDAGQFARLRAATEHQGEHFEQIPALIVACYRAPSLLERSHGNRGALLGALAKLGARDVLATIAAAPRASAMAQAASVYPGVQNLLLTARALGLGATLTTLHLAAEREFKLALDIPSRTRTFALIPVGYPTGHFGDVRRKQLDDLIRWQRW
jgi:nitroreductase